MSNRSFIVTNDTISVIVNGKSYLVEKKSPHAGAILSALVDDSPDEVLIQVLDLATAVKKYAQGNIEIEGDTLKYKGEVVHNCVVTRIQEFMRRGLPFEPLLRFLEKLMANPSRNSREQLYQFLEHKHLPVTTDGDFLAYKGVQSDFWSCRAGDAKLVQGRTNDQGQVFNGIGEVLEVARSYVDDNPNNHCSHGLHVGSYEYASTYASNVVIVKCNPADVVSVPTDCSFQKVRTAKYTVLCASAGPLGGELIQDLQDVYQRQAAFKEIESHKQSIAALEAALQQRVEEPEEDDEPEVQGPYTVTSYHGINPVASFTSYDVSEIDEFTDTAEAAGLNVRIFNANGDDITDDSN